MKHITTRTLLSVILCITLLMSLAMLFASCGKDASDKLTYELNTDGTGYIVTGCEIKKPKTIIIPSEYNGLPVIGIGDKAFDTGRSSVWSVETVVIPDSVTEIGESAFSKCRISSLTLSKNLQSIGESAFTNTDTKGLELPNTLTYIGAKAFGFTLGTDDDVEDGIMYCGNWAVLAEDSVTKVTLREGTVGVAAGAFTFGYVEKNNVGKVQSALEEIDLGADMLYICDGAFSNCVSLTNVKFGDNLKSIGENAFENCKGLTKVELGNNLKTIEKGAFSGCENLTDVSLPNSLESIGSSVFAECKKLETLSLPADLQYVKKDFITHNCACTFAGTIEQWKTVIGDDTRNIKQNYTVECTDGTY